MDWFKLPSVYPEIEMWGAVELPFQYAMSYDSTELKYSVSVKQYPNTDKTKWLGEYFSRTDAEAACDAHWSNNRQ